MPLHFVLQTAFIKMGMGPIRSAYPVTILSAIGVATGLYVLLRRMGANRISAAPVCIMVFATGSAQYLLFSIRGDLLPVAFTLWGWALCAKGFEPPRGRLKLCLSGLLFALAVMSKITAVYACAVACACLFLNGERRQALRLALATAGATLLLLGVAIWLSEGRIVQYFLRTGTAAADWRYAVRAPMRFLGCLAATLSAARSSVWRGVRFSLAPCAHGDRCRR